MLYKELLELKALRPAEKPLFIHSGLFWAGNGRRCPSIRLSAHPREPVKARAERALALTVAQLRAS